MPEGPELAISRDRIGSLIKGRNILSITLGPVGRFLKKQPEGYDKIVKKLQAAPAKFEEIHTKGKFMWWSLSFPDDQEMWYMFTTYGMSGQWDLNKSKHTAAMITFSDHLNLFFNDQRRFGTLKFVRGKKELDKKLSTIGPCILGPEITFESFCKSLQKKQHLPICEVLMDQSCVSGVGNYLRAEILYACKINPWQKVSQISNENWSLLFSETLKIANASYQSQGATLYTFKNIDGSSGGAQFLFKVYGENFDPHGFTILREEDSNGRTIHWCPEVQK